MKKEYHLSNPNYEEVIRESFAKQKIMQTLGAKLIAVTPGKVIIELPFHEKLTQQHGFLHAGVIATVVDSACGYAALSLLPVDTAVLSIEFKINMLSPAKGEKLIAIGEIIRAGRNVTVCQGEAISVDNGIEKKSAIMQATMIKVSGHSDLQG